MTLAVVSTHYSICVHRTNVSTTAAYDSFFFAILKVSYSLLKYAM